MIDLNEGTAIADLSASLAATDVDLVAVDTDGAILSLTMWHRDSHSSLRGRKGIALAHTLTLKGRRCYVEPARQHGNKRNARHRRGNSSPAAAHQAARACLLLRVARRA